MHSVFEITTLKNGKTVVFMVIRKNSGSIDILGLRSYDRQLVIRCFANWVCSGLQHLYRVCSGPGRTGYVNVCDAWTQLFRTLLNSPSWSIVVDFTFTSAKKTRALKIKQRKSKIKETCNIATQPRQLEWRWNRSIRRRASTGRGR